MALSESAVSAQRSLLKGQRIRKIRESLTAYLFLFPALTIIGVFGLFPLAFAFYVSLHHWRIVRGKYAGLANYVKAIDNLAYFAFFWVSILLIYLAVKKIIAMHKESQEVGGKWAVWIVHAFITAAGLAWFVKFFFTFLPGVLEIGMKLRGVAERTTEVFRQFLKEAWLEPAVQAAFRQSLLIIAVGLVLAYLVHRFVDDSNRGVGYYSALISISIMLIAGILLGWLTWTEVQAAYAKAMEEGKELAIWSQLVTISAGFLLLYLSWIIWKSAQKAESTLSFAIRFGAVAALILGGWILIAELPPIIISGDKDWWRGLQVTAYYSFFTVPFQLGLSMFLASLLFQNIKGKTFFRLIYFLPYITNPVAAAGIFRVLFSGKPNSPVNNIITALGGQPLKWLDDPTGLFQLLFPHANIPDWIAGPSLALVVIILYNIWTYVGYDTVIFLAGLGGIPKELYEAASIDGADRFAQFRHITVPLLSPTIYFLTLIAVIGTFKAFTHVWVLRSAAALGTTDTASVVIFLEFSRNTRYGYASSLAIILLGVVLILTLINNYVASKKVFYG